MLKKENLERFNQNIKHCKDCDSAGLNKRLVSGILAGSGNIDSHILFVGQNPSVVRYSTNDIIFGNVNVSKTDKTFCDGLKSIGLTRDDVYVTNLVKGSTPLNRLPTHDELIHGMSHLVEEIRIINPKIIVCVGALVCQEFNVKFGKISKKHYIYFGMNHPTSVVRNSTTMEEYLLQWQQLKELVNSTEKSESLTKWLK